MTHATIPTIYVLEGDQAPPLAHRALLTLARDEADTMVVHRSFPSGVIAPLSGFTPLPSGGYQDSDGTQYVVLKWCQECRDWMGVDASLNFTHDSHSRRTA